MPRRDQASPVLASGFLQPGFDKEGGLLVTFTDPEEIRRGELLCCVQIGQDGYAYANEEASKQQASGSFVYLCATTTCAGVARASRADG